MFKKKNPRGAWVAQLVERPPCDFSAGRDLMGPGIELPQAPAQQGFCLGFSLSLCLWPSPHLSSSLSHSPSKINKYI